MDLTNRKSLNLRTAEMDPKMGKNPTENPGIMPGATPETPAQKESNTTKQYYGGNGAGSGPWGGENAAK